MPNHIMCIGWPTIRRLAAGEALWFEDLECGAVAADDLHGADVDGMIAARIGEYDERIWLERVGKAEGEAAWLQKENAILREMLLNPDPDMEPDNIRFHREKCDALERLWAALRERDALRASWDEECAENTKLRAEVDAWHESQKANADNAREQRERAERAEAEVAKLREQLVSAQWRPIETAPKDGKWVHLADKDEVMQGYWFNAGKCWLGCWPGNWEPTHWRPLPAPPTLTDETGNPEATLPTG